MPTFGKGVCFLDVHHVFVVLRDVIMTSATVQQPVGLDTYIQPMSMRILVHNHQETAPRITNVSMETSQYSFVAKMQFNPMIYIFKSRMNSCYSHEFRPLRIASCVFSHPSGSSKCPQVPQKPTPEHDSRDNGYIGTNDATCCHHQTPPAFCE